MSNLRLSLPHKKLDKHTQSQLCMCLHDRTGRVKKIYIRACVSCSPDMYVFTSRTLQLKNKNILYIISNTDSSAKKPNTFTFISYSIAFYLLTFRHRASSIQDRRFATLQRTLFIYLINKYISLSDTCLTVHH